MRIGLSLPLYDEGDNVDRVVADILGVADRHGLDLVLCLVDNGSRDDTGARVDALVAGDPRVRAVHLADNAGYGGGILAGVHHLVATEDPDAVGWTWGDGQVDPAVLPALAAASEAGAMLAKARRIERQDGLQRRVVTGAYAQVMRRVMGVDTPDVNGCPKLLRREAWAELAPQSTDWFLDPEVVMAVEERGWPVADAPVVMRPRTAGRSKVRWGTVVEFLSHLRAWRAGRRPGDASWRSAGIP